MILLKFNQFFFYQLKYRNKDDEENCKYFKMKRYFSICS